MTKARRIQDHQTTRHAEGRLLGRRKVIPDRKLETKK